jgi:mannose-6-phosphate isomerase
MEPIQLQANRVWRTYRGGRNLDLLEGVEQPADSNFPEDWIASLTRAVNPGREHLTEEGLSRVKYLGETFLLKNFIEKYSEEILGKKHFEQYGLAPTFLLKLLDSAIRLHIQCHPTAAFAKRFLNSNHGKTEAYYILGTREDVELPFIYLGFQHPPSREQLKSAIEQQDIAFLEGCFEKIPVQKGDSFYVPAGLPHAIGAGVFMIEIMEPSDHVIRIEFEKAGYVLPEKARFMDRGIDFGLYVFDYSPYPVETVQEDFFINERLLASSDGAEEYILFDKRVTSFFRLNKLIVKGKHLLEKEGYYILIVTEGSGEIQSGSQSFQVQFGDKFLIPASCSTLNIIADPALEFIIAMPPE